MIPSGSQVSPKGKIWVLSKSQITIRRNMNAQRSVCKKIPLSRKQAASLATVGGRLELLPACNINRSIGVYSENTL